MMEVTPGTGQRFVLVQVLRRMISCVLVMFLALAFGNNGLTMWQQGWALLERYLQSVYPMLEDSR